MIDYENIDKYETSRPHIIYQIAPSPCRGGSVEKSKTTVQEDGL